MGERFAVTGATGFVGRALCSHLERCFPSAPILALGRKSMAVTPSLPSVPVDMVTEEDRFIQLLEDFKPTVIFQLAALALYSPPEDQHAQYRKVNTEIPLKVAELAKRLGALNVYTSTDLVFDGKTPPYSPSSQTNPLTIYGQSKRDAELSLLKDGNSLVVRYSQLIGLHGTFFAMIRSNFTQSKPMDLFDDEFRSILCVDDAVRLLLALVQKAADRAIDLSVPWHLGGPDSVSRYFIGQEVIRILGADPNLLSACKASMISKIPRPADTTMDSSATFNAAFIPRSAAEAIAFALQDRYEEPPQIQDAGEV